MTPPICNKCHGVEPHKDANKINSHEEFREAVNAANEQRYGEATEFQIRLCQKIRSMTKERQYEILNKIFELAAEEVAEMSNEEIEQEFKEDGVDTDAIRERVLNVLRKVKNEK